MALAARSPRSRKSMSLSEQNLNILMDATTLPVTNRELMGKRRMAASIGGEGLAGLTFSVGKTSDLSPRRAARRSMVGRVIVEHMS